MRSRASGAARLDASFWCFCIRVFALSELRLSRYRLEAYSTLLRRLVDPYRSPFQFLSEQYCGLGIHPLASSSTTWIMSMKGVMRLLRALLSWAIHSLPFTGSVKRKHAPPLELFSAQIRPP